MTDEEKMMYMFTAVQGAISGSCSAEVYYSDSDLEPAGVNCMKDGNVAWAISKSDILFNYMTRDMVNTREAKLCGENAYHTCNSCGWELFAEQVDEVASGEFAPCPNCRAENYVGRDDED